MTENPRPATGGPSSSVRRGSRVPTPARAVPATAALALLAACASGGPPDRAPGPAPGAASEPAAPPAREIRSEPLPVDRYYWVYVANDSADVVSRLRFGPGDFVYEKAIPVGTMPTEVDGPRGVRVSSDGRFWYVTTARGARGGRLWKFETGTDRLVGDVTVGEGASDVALSAEAGEAWVANEGRPGAPGASTVSVVDTRTMREVARIATCEEPSGSRLTADGQYEYSTCAANDVLVEVATARKRATRTLRLLPGDRCEPRWAEPGREGRYVYVACHARDEVLRVDRDAWEVTGRLEVGDGPWAMEVTPDGRELVVANRRDGSVSVVDLAREEEIRRVETSRERPHAVAISPDGRYAFVTSRAAGAGRGVVDVIDLPSLRRVATVQVEHGTAGIGFWRWRPAGG